MTDYDCWRTKPAPAASGDEAQPDRHVLLNEILSHLKTATQNAVRLMRKTVELIAGNQERLARCPSLHALELAVWSDKRRIDRDEFEKLRPLWGRYFNDVPHES